MDAKKKIRLSLAEWKEISSGLELSPGDLSMITSGLRLLTKSQLELATLARTQHLEDNLADSLEDWGNKSQELLTRGRSPDSHRFHPIRIWYLSLNSWHLLTSAWSKLAFPV